MSRNPIDELIEANEAKIAAAERSIEKLKIEVSALRKARQAVSDHVGTILDKVVETPRSPPTAAAPRKGRSLSTQWKQVLGAIGKIGDQGANLDQVYALCQQQAIELKRPTLRAQMSNYVSRGYLGRTGQGKFFLTLAGLRVAGLMKAPAQAGEGDRGPALTGPRQDGEARGSSSG